MPNQTKDGGITAADVDQKLPRGYFVKRGDITKAFGLSRAEMDALVPEVFTPAPIPPKPGRPARKQMKHRFVRSQVMKVAHQWERGA